MPPKRPSNLVYSTELGRTCPSCRQSLSACTCRNNATRILGDGNVKVGRESKGRGGKVVTLISGLAMNAADLAVLATKLKKRCGTGGTVHEGIIEIQGDHRDKLVQVLTELGIRARRVGA